ncbi:MAG: hypothetical protein ABFS10_01030, partial [Bacteroidota bacterium]
DPYLIITDSLIEPWLVEHNGLTGEEILEVQKLYADWWTEHGEEGVADGPQPLEGSIYMWF